MIVAGIVTGAQIRAGRALLSWTRLELAAAAGLHKNAVAYWEKRPQIPAGKHPPHAVARIIDALTRAGIEAFSSPTAGVRFVPGSQLRGQSAQARAGG